MKKVPAEVYSRVCGYFRPVNQWNRGKQEEFDERTDLLPKSTSLTEKEITERIK
jgi:hypothetical protein